MLYTLLYCCPQQQKVYHTILPFLLHLMSVLSSWMWSFLIESPLKTTLIFIFLPSKNNPTISISTFVNFVFCKELNNTKKTKRIVANFLWFLIKLVYQVMLSAVFLFFDEKKPAISPTMPHFTDDIFYFHFPAAHSMGSPLFDSTGLRYSYVGRPCGASTATGSKAQHVKELKNLLDDAMAL